MPELPDAEARSWPSRCAPPLSRSRPPRQSVGVIGLRGKLPVRRVHRCELRPHRYRLPREVPNFASHLSVPFPSAHGDLANSRLSAALAGSDRTFSIAVAYE